jgi:hypothetical protein
MLLDDFGVAKLEATISAWLSDVIGSPYSSTVARLTLCSMRRTSVLKVTETGGLPFTRRGAATSVSIVPGAPVHPSSWSFCISD